MTSHRHHFPLLAILLLLPIPSWAGAPDIIPPDPMAIELPAGTSGIGVDDPPLRALLAKVTAGGDRVTATLPQNQLGVGVWRVILSAWDPSDAVHPAARRETWLFILPNGMTPVGTSGAQNATAGNNTLHIVRDRGLALHMVWYNAWNPLGNPPGQEGAMYRRVRILPNGPIAFDTDAIPLAKHPGDWRAMPTTAVFGDTVHFAWQADGRLWYRFLTLDHDIWRWSDEVDTNVPSTGRDTGPSIAVDASGVHILTPAGIYTTSADGGKTWTTEAVPFGAGVTVKTVSLTLDRDGRALAAASIIAIDKGTLTEDTGHGGYWTIRLFQRVSPGHWEPVPGPLDGRSEWAAPSRPDQDVLADWVRVKEDLRGGIHITWHGTAVSRIYGHDRAYYAWRSPEGAWQAPVPLENPDADRGFGSSYAPGLTLDGDRALTLVFHALHAGRQERGFDSELGLFRDGKSLAPPLPVTRFVERSIIQGEPENALSAWFPGAAPSLFRTADGRVWADILVTLVPTGVQAPSLIVWARKDLSSWLKAAGQ